jgi:hypothetical protein
LPRASPSPRFQTANDKRKRFANLWTPEGNPPAGLLPPLDRFVKRRRKKERKTWARVFMAEIQI